jgi:polyphosphate kinase
MDAVVRIPQQLPRFVRLPGASLRLLPIEDLIQLRLPALFPNCMVTGSGLARVIRDSDLPIEDLEMEEDAEHLLLSFETALQRSRHGEIVWLAVAQSIPPDLVGLLVRELHVPADAVDLQPGLIGLANLAELTREDRPDLKFRPYAARYPERVREFGGDCFAAIRAKEILVHHPYESFDVVVQFIRQAAADPAVVAIKQTLYRTSENSPIVQALVEAAQAGKSVTAVVELKARFDEEANLKWARDLERAGAQVTYGFIQLKIHAKLSLVIRREAEGLASYIHYGTGNYHPLTARVYTDLSLFSSDPRLCADAARLFNYMTGFAEPEPFERIAAAPLTLRSTLLALIRAETDFARAGQPAMIWFKVNGLVDPEIIEALYEASSAGVSIRGIVRGICALRAGVPGLSENIRIHSIVGRFLEHARMACFGNGQPLPSDQAKIFLSSADWMPRNLDRRIETLIPIETDTIRRQIMDQIMLANLNDDAHAWELTPRDDWKRVKHGRHAFSAQDYFMDHPSFSGRGNAPVDQRFPPALTLHKR